MFDANRDYKVKILSGGERFARLRFPSDEELCDRQKKVKSVRRSLGRGKTQWDQNNVSKANAELFGKIRLDEDGEVFDEADAHRFVEKLLRVDVTNVTRNGDGFHVELSVPGGSVEHHLSMPTQKDILEHDRSVSRVIDSRIFTEIRVSLEPTGALWDKLMVGVNGYADGRVPITHKDAAMSAVLSQMDSESDDDPEL